MATPYVEEGPDGLVFVDENGSRHPAYLMKQALEKADISESTFYRWIRSNRVPDVKLRNRANWRIFTDAEQALCHRKAHSLAVRFAGKEAVMKLLGTGIIGIRWRDIEILAYDTGKPRLQLYGGAKRKAEELGLEDIAISLSHSDEYAIATAFSTSKR